MDNFDWQGEYERLTSLPISETSRPVIGITGNWADETVSLAEGYYRSVLCAGAVPFIIPPYEDTSSLGDLLDNIDGIIFSGGGDINPLYLGEEPVPQLHSVNPVRDRQELLLARMAYDRQLPMLGICKGIQVICAALGGENYQDLGSQKEGLTVKHSQDLDRRYPSHKVTLASFSKLAEIFGKEELLVNSFHHQAVKSVPQSLRVSALSTDGVIEAIESTEYKSIIGVQWHPETFILRGNEEMMPLFRWLHDEADSFRRAKTLHSRILSLDSHCDTPMFFHAGIDFGRRDPRILVDLHKMQEGHLDSTIMVAYLEQKERDDDSLQKSVMKATGILNQIEDMIAKNAPHLAKACTPDDLWRNKRRGIKSIMLGIENGYGIGKDLSNLERFRKRGVVYMTLCHNGDNDICDSARGNGEHGGVSEFGEKVIKEMNRLGMMVDLSHGADSSFYDALEISDVPIVCSHSSSRTLCDHPRNITDDMMRALAKKGGVAQTTFYSGFLRTDGAATIRDAVEHLNHAVDVMGIDYVGIGTDFDGDGGVPGCASASELINFTRCLLRQRYSDEDIQKIWGGNFLRVMREVQDAGAQFKG